MTHRADLEQGGDGELLERFAPTTGLVVGWTGLLLAAGIATVALTTLAGPTAVRVALAAAAAAVLVWVTQLRPRALAYREVLLLRGSLRDVRIPWRAVQEVSMGQTLVVRARGRRYRCVGIGRPMGAEVRRRVRSQTQSGLLGPGRAADHRAEHGPGQGPGAGHDLTYESFVLTRIQDLVAQASTREARRTAGDRTRPVRSVRSSYAVPPVVALAAAAGALLLSLVV